MRTTHQPKQEAEGSQKRNNHTEIFESKKQSTFSDRQAQTNRNKTNLQTSSKSDGLPDQLTIISEVRKNVEPVYFNLAIAKHKKVNAVNFWNSRENTDLGNWIRHRRNVEQKAKPTLDNKLPIIFFAKLEKDKRYKQHLTQVREEKRKAANRYLKERCFQARASIDKNAFNEDFRYHRHLSAKISRVVKIDNGESRVIPRNVIQELRITTPPMVVKRPSRLPPITEKRMQEQEPDGKQ